MVLVMVFVSALVMVFVMVLMMVFVRILITMRGDIIKSCGWDEKKCGVSIMVFTSNL